MANKRDTSSQKRARANRAQREALAARTTAAATPAPSRVAPAGGSTSRRTRDKVARPPSERSTSSTAGTGTKGTKAPRAVRPRLGDTPVDVDTLEGNHIRKVMQVPGGSQVLMGLAISVLAAFLTASQRLVLPPGTPASNPKKLKFTRTLIGAFGWSHALPILLAPVVVLAVAAAMGLHKSRRRIWMVCAFVLALLIFSRPIYYLYFFIPLGMLVYGIMRANKIDGPPPARARRAPAAGDEVDAEVADDDVEDDDDDDAASRSEPAPTVARPARTTPRGRDLRRRKSS